MTLFSVENFVPVFPYGFVTEGAYCFGHFCRSAFVAYGELFERLRICVVTSRVGFRAGAERCGAECEHIVAEIGTFTGGVGYVHIVVEYAKGECQLCQFAVAFYNNLREYTGGGTP